MIDRKVAASQVERLSGLNWYPRENAPLHELNLAAEAAYNEFILAYVVDEWLKYQTEAPKPAQLRGMIWEENNKLDAERELERQEKLSQRGARCPNCHDFGVVESIKGGPLESICRYCDCSVGRRLFADEKEDPTPFPFPEGVSPKPSEVNAARAKLLKLAGRQAGIHALIQRTAKTKIFGDDYHGDY